MNFPRSSILFVHPFLKLIANHMTSSFLNIPKWIRISHPSYLRIWWVFGIIKRVSNGMITNLAIKNNTLVYCGQKCSSCVCRVTLSIDVSHQLSRNSCFVVLPFSDTIFWTFKNIWQACFDFIRLNSLFYFRSIL